MAEAQGKRVDPYLANRFKIVVEIDGVEEAGFAECSGLTVETEIEERREGGVNQYVHRLPRGSKYSNIVLKRGVTDSASLWNWHQKIISGTVESKSLSIVLMDSSGGEKWRWNVQNAFPVKWTGPEFKADGAAVAIETLELAHHGIAKQ